MEDSENLQEDDQVTVEISEGFKRKFENPDMSTCWLNSCLQLILTGLDYDEYVSLKFNSELGLELLRLQSNSQYNSLDPTIIKDILTATEDLRIASRLSELSYRITDQNELERQSRQLRNIHLDLKRGQQCVRDFFVCLNENLVAWPDVFSNFSISLTHSTECLMCQTNIQSETYQIYLEIDVPPPGSNLKFYIETLLNEGTKQHIKFEEKCKSLSEKVKRTSLTNSDEADFLIILLSRGIETPNGFQMLENETKATDIINIRGFRIQLVQCENYITACQSLIQSTL